MADLSSLIRLHKYELDEKRRALSVLYTEMAELETRLEAMDDELQREKEALTESGDVGFTFAGYAQRMKQQRDALMEEIFEAERRIHDAKDDMMETFSELKKYEMTQEERDRVEEEQRGFQESLRMDEIALETFRRRVHEEDA